ncbi:5084_t:CDS:2 [Funneliformis caledonium]|uniref:5084_t:CDS:1 n=1 Tax=Funneliformis caledonium TaxID=1117310 RepID=A0A9N9G2H0_9GLOM|nr:5084_t:CDS:2 [Funneliformis caledonium]
MTIFFCLCNNANVISLINNEDVLTLRTLMHFGERLSPSKKVNWIWGDRGNTKCFSWGTINNLNTNQFQNQTFQGPTENVITNNKSNERKRSITPPNIRTEEDNPVVKKESDDGNPSLTKDENDNVDEVDDNDEYTPDPDDVFNSYSKNSQNWSLLPGKTVEDIFATNILIDLSAHMIAWFTNSDRHFMTKTIDLLKVSELPEDINTFISAIEKAFSFIINGLNKERGIRQKCRKCDECFLASSRMDLGSGFVVRATDA